ncbi:hypothetical protein KOR34_23420 [Posidoniimonas corsicana]|uniref:PEP-CTERM protein-sorting domain-containing protein n=1 Tax=Posidoniimonas corsicana TaxID=1938618 RepID=A0A5C5VI78_9BACT|nr:hypothetical protein [Posidoniimonas corsicana]TWT37392.1 hypothetical protein KOR34_23420 [Posidoniimonas corsicana]
MPLLDWFKRPALAGLVVALGAAQASALYIPDKLFGGMYTDFGDMPSTTINHPNFEFITPFPSEYVLEETGITGSFPPVGEEGGAFERNEHQIRFVTDGETSGGQATGHKFQRREAWDFAFDMKIETPNPQIRKEAGMYFKSPVGNALFLATTNDGFYTDGPGTISTIFEGVIPGYNFSSTGGPLGDYNGNGRVDAADYTVWRDTLGSTEDFRANGNNEGASENFIDEADYQVWRDAFGEGSEGGQANYEAGDTVRMRLIYTPPELADEGMPDIVNDPNVVTAGTLEYIISLNGGAEISSGPLTFENEWQGIPNDTQIAWRVQNLGTQAVVNDSSKVTFSNFDFNGDLPGTGLGEAPVAAGLATAPEPTGAALLALAGVAVGAARRRGGCWGRCGER